MISVIIPTYNRWKYLRRAVNSVINQTYQNFELIIVNDASTHMDYINYQDIVKSDIRIIWINLPINMRKKYNSKNAQGITRNEGVNVAKGEYLAFLDDDDFWAPNKLELQLQHMNKENSLFCSTNGYKYYDKNNDNNKLEIFHPYLPDKLNLNDILHTNVIICSSVIIHKELFEKVSGFRIVLYEDYDLWKRVLNLGVVCHVINLPLIYYDVNHGNGIFYDSVSL